MEYSGRVMLLDIDRPFCPYEELEALYRLKGFVTHIIGYHVCIVSEDVVYKKTVGIYIVHLKSFNARHMVRQSTLANCIVL